MRKARVDVARERPARRAGARARRRAKRWRDSKQGARPEEIEAARARVAAADAQIAVLEKALRRCAVIAPVAGVVTQKLVDAGEIVDARHAARRRHRSRSTRGRICSCPSRWCRA